MFSKKRFGLWGGSAVGPNRTGTILLRRSARLLALVQVLEILTVRFLSGLDWLGSVGAKRSAVVWLLVRFVSVLFPGGV